MLFYHTTTTRNTVLAALAALLLVTSAGTGAAQTAQPPTDEGPTTTPGGATNGTAVGGPGPATGRDNATETGSQPVTPDQFEPNDDRDTATALAPGAYGNLTIGENDTDYYDVALAAGETLTVELSFDGTAGDIDAALLSADAVVETSTGVTDTESITYVAPTNGTYTVSVYGFGGDTNSYDMNVSVGAGRPVSGTPDRFEPNDDFDNATAVGEGEFSNLSVTGGDVDIYALDVTAGRPLSVSVEFDHERGDLDAVLVDRESVLPLAVSDSVTDDEVLSYLPPENDTYYAAVVGFQNATGTYNLTVEGATAPATPANTTASPADRTGVEVG